MAFAERCTLELELGLNNLALIATDNDEVPSGEGFMIEDRIDSVVIPIPRMGQLGVWIMTIALAAISTAICYIIASMLDFESRSFPNHWFMKCVPFAAWVLSVFGPLTVYFLLPSGWWNPDHWLQFHRGTGVLSFRGGFHQWDRKQIRYLLAINGYRARRRKLESELQICVGETKPFKRYLLLATQNGDPEKSYGEIIRVFASTMEVPAYVARISSDGSHELVQVVEPSNAPKSPIGHDSKS